MNADDGFLDGDELAALEWDAPVLAKALQASQAAIQRLAGTVEELRHVQHRQLAHEHEAVTSEVQDAIDTNTILSAWQTAPDQTMWNEASRIDKALRESPVYANVSFADRFEKVVELTQSAFDMRENQERERQEQETHGAERPTEQRASGKNLEDISTAELGQQFIGKSLEEIQDYISKNL